MGLARSLSATLLVASSVMLAAATTTAAAEETTYAPLPDPRVLSFSPPSVETGYNAAGTASVLPHGLLSARRDEPGHRGFLLGMQAASIARDEQPLNVAPLAAVTLEEQLHALRRRGVTLFLLDAPDPEDAREFLTAAQPLGLNAVLLVGRAPSWRTPPVVIATPLLLAERAGEMALRSLGGEEGSVAFVPLAEEKDVAGIEAAAMERLFRNSIQAVAPDVVLLELDPEAEESPGEGPDVICLITEESTARWMTGLRERFPDAILIGTGESPAIMEALEDGTLDVRVRHDYRRLLETAIREARERSEFPVTVQPVADRRRPAETPPE